MGVRHKRMEQLDGQNSSFIEGEDDYNKSENKSGDASDTPFSNGRLHFWSSSFLIVFIFGRLPLWSSSILLVFHFGHLPFWVRSYSILGHTRLGCFNVTAKLIVVRLN